MDLSGTWELCDEAGECSVQATLPGDIHSALIQAQSIPHPYLEQNELDVQWIGKRDWIFTRKVTIPAFHAGIAAHKPARYILHADVFDTLGTVVINGTEVWRSVSMFIPVWVDVTDVIQDGENIIEIRVQSAEKAAVQRAQLLPYPIPHSAYPVQSPHRNLVRKTQCHSGWDWGPCLMVGGVYGRLELRECSNVIIVNAWGVPVRTKGDVWSLPVHVEIDAVEDEEVTFTSVLLLGDKEITRVQGVQNGSGIAFVELHVERPELWWPAQYGEQVLYTLRVSIDGKNTLDAGERIFQVGFRTIELVSDFDGHGSSMFFRVNGRDIWAKGANWLPSDALPSNQTVAMECLLHDAAAANMNMLRVWGGGQYESDRFYDLCDKLGILIWQDFMFSCSLYPAEDWFLDEVRMEVRAQVKRLQSHACIALWCGNNENIGALGWFEESLQDRDRYVVDFDRLNHGMIEQELRKLDTTRVFWPSSPAAGTNNFSDNWHDDSSGDMHFWSVWHEGKPFEAYYSIKPRFCSEFGFQSFPSLHEIQTFAPKEQWNPTAPVMEHHQRHPRGNALILSTMAHYFRIPFDFAEFVYVSQVQQAMAIRMAVDYWRSQRPVCMGALYWQLHDLWPAASWSGIEHSGHWKLLHYEARRFFAPLRITITVRDGVLWVYVVNDTKTSLEDSVCLRALDWYGNEIWKKESFVTAHIDSATLVGSYELQKLPFDPHEAFVVAELRGGSTDRAWSFLTEPKRCALKQPKVTVKTATVGNADTLKAMADISITHAPAFWLTLEGTDDVVHFVDNGFLMLPGETRAVEITCIGDSKAAGTTSRLRSAYTKHVDIRTRYLT